MLNYWRTTGATTGRPSTPLILPAASPFSDYGFDGPFFDLEFTLSNHINDNASLNSGDSSEYEDEDMREIQLNLDAINQTYKPRSTTESNHPEENSKFPLSIVKTAGKFGVLFQKPNSSNEKPKNELLRVKFKVDEVKGPLISLFARDCSISEDPVTNSDSEKLGKEILHKYLNILKPLYVRVEKMKFSGQLRAPPEMAKSGFRSNTNLQAGIKVVRKHLGKSRSTSAAAAVVSPPGNRRDDSLLEVQDGILGAILHCKRSFHSDSERQLSRTRSVSDACCDKSVISSTLYSGKLV
ncbi:probable membrane-associated kinase regulator 2 [Salvia splendens]|uniref:probable membrane-associated kinase regulator 2 n=1 Tax=Salvia splendens TaxID=180675 RepID=UPI001C255B8B|nr:probable membrane-associated kinase regulator 2 [Salvia splendens]